VSETTREKLIAVAQQFFRQRGYEGTSVAAVAEQLNISAPAVYYHFPSKDSLLFATQEAYMLDMIAALERAAARGTAAERLRAFVETHAATQITTFGPAGHGHVFGVTQLIAQLEGEPRERLKRLSRRVLDLLREIIRQGVADGSFAPVDPTSAAFAIIGMDHHLVHWYSPDGPLTAERLCSLHAEFALRIVGASPANPNTPPRRRAKSAPRVPRRRRKGRPRP